MLKPKSFDKDNNRIHTTSSQLLNQGICLCDKCGKPTSIDYKWCKYCKEIVLVQRTEENNDKTIGEI